MNQFIKIYKKRVSGIISLLLTICLVSPTKAEEVYYCSTELATGIVKENGKWRAGRFEKLRYIAKFNSDFTQVEGFGYIENSPPLDCHTRYDFLPGALSCSKGGAVLIFNRIKLRFTFFQGSSGGYAFDLDDPDTESMYAGTCEKF